MRINLKPEFSHAFTKNNYFLRTSLALNYSYKDYDNQNFSEFIPILCCGNNAPEMPILLG